MQRKLKVGIVGATGMVGQRFVSLLAEHPWFEVTTVAASPRSAGQSYVEAVDGRWAFDFPIPSAVRSLIVQDAGQVRAVAEAVDFVVCAVDMDKDAIRALEEQYARTETPVVSNNSAHRSTADVPMIIPELNPEHLALIPAQRRRLGTTRGFITVKPNCSIQSYVPALHPLRRFKPSRVVVCTYQAISGAGKTFATWPEMLDNVIPLIKGEEEKSEREPLKLWGQVQGGRIALANTPEITTQCLRVPVSDGHMAAVFVDFEHTPSMSQMQESWSSFSGRPQQLQLPSAPRQLIHYFSQPDRPQTRLDRDLERGMAVSVGRLRPDQLFDYRFVCLSHNTLRGAAGGAVLMAELLVAEGYITAK